jgi:hypothetical protein
MNAGITITDIPFHQVSESKHFIRGNTPVMPKQNIRPIVNCAAVVAEICKMTPL